MRITRIPIPVAPPPDHSTPEPNEAADFVATADPPTAETQETSTDGELRYVFAAAEEQEESEYAAGTSEELTELDATRGGSGYALVTQQTDELPEEWGEILGGHQHYESALEASALVLRAELQDYRESLIDLETHIRVVQMNLNEVSQLGVVVDVDQTAESGWLSSLNSSRNQLRQFLEKWCARLSGIVHILRNVVSPADHEDLQDSFLQQIERQLAEQEKHCAELARLPSKSSNREAVSWMLSELPPQVNHCHLMEQLLQETLIALLVRQRRLAQWDSHEFTDPSTHLRNRAGLELWLRQWRDDESRSQRQLSAIMLDVDNSLALNTQWGTRIGDLILNSLGTMINGVLRKNRGVDFTVRCSGQSYVVVLADTGPRGANSAAERIRQTIEQCYFEHPFGKIQVTVSAGVSDIRPHDSLVTLIDRLKRAIRTAKQAGRNCAALDEGTGPICLMAPQLRIKEHSAATTIYEVEQELLNEQAELAAV